jgi:hypothetical protein
MQGYALPVTNENLKKIVDAVADFLPKKKEDKKEEKKAGEKKEEKSAGDKTAAPEK